MVKAVKPNDNTSANTQTEVPQQSQMAEQLGAAMNQQQQTSGLNVFDLLNADLSNYADGTSGVRAAHVLAELKEFRDKEKIPEVWQTGTILDPELPNGEMLIIYVVIEDQAYVHPVLFAEPGGRTYQATNAVNGMTGMVQESKASSASITRIGGFKNILLKSLNSAGHTRVKKVEDIAVCGCTLYHKGNEIKPNNLMANASNEVFAIISAQKAAMNPNVRKVTDFQGSEILVDSTANADKINIHGSHIFAPVVINGIARRKSTLEGSSGHHNEAIGEVCGYMDFVPYSPQARQQELLLRQQANNPQRVPSHKPFFVITDEEWANFKGSTCTPENLLTLFMLLPSIADGALWVPRVINAADAGFNSLYDFASVGYDEEGFNKPFDECHVSTKFDIAAQQKYGQDYFSSVSICMDVSLAGPNAGGLGLLLDGTQLNRMVTNLTGQQHNFPAIGKQSGRIPLGHYIHQGKKRDIRELLNYYSWAKFVNGDRTQLQRWHQWFVLDSGQNEERVFAERCKMADEISNGTFELQDTALRILLDDNVINSIRNAFTSNNVLIKVNQSAIQGTNTGYGFNGDFSGGMTMQQNQVGVMGGAINVNNVW